MLRPVRNHVVVPSLSADQDPELVCWTLPGGNAPFELTIVLEGPLMTGHIVFGSRRLSVAPLEGSGGPAAAFSLEGKMVAVVDPSRGCLGKVFFDDALERDAQTAVSFAVSVLMWATPYENRLNRVHNC